MQSLVGGAKAITVEVAFALATVEEEEEEEEGRERSIHLTELLPMMGTSIPIKPIISWQ